MAQRPKFLVVRTISAFLTLLASLTQALSRHPSSCLFSNATIEPRCTEILDLDHFLLAWYANTPKCGTDPQLNVPASPCCGTDELWSDCFIKMVLPNDGASCRAIGGCFYGDIPLVFNVSNTTTWWRPEPRHSTNVDPTHVFAPLDTSLASIVSSYRYVVYIIYAVNWFFGTWYRALQIAWSGSSTTVASIVEAIDPGHKTTIALDRFMLAISLGLPFVAGPGSRGIADTATQDAGASLLKSLQQAPAVAKALWPTDTASAATMRLSEINSQDAGVTKGVEDILNKGLYIIMNDINNFMDFTLLSSESSESPFAQRLEQRPSVPSEAKGILTALTTFLISSTLEANDWKAFILGGIDPLQLSTNSSAELPTWANCTECGKQKDMAKFMGCQGYNSNNQCGRWWYSSNLNSAFTLQGPSKQDAGQLMIQIFNSGWTTGALLFETASSCDAASLLQAQGIATDASQSNMLAGYINANRALRDLPTFWQNIADVYANHKAFAFNIESRGTLTTIMLRVQGPLEHPAHTLQSYTQGGIDFSCTSQLSMEFPSNLLDAIKGKS